MANTMRILAGTRIACAQCHDHPSDKWTRKQMFGRRDGRVYVECVDDGSVGAVYQNRQGQNLVADREMQRTSQMIRNAFYRDQVTGVSDGTRSSCRKTTSTPRRKAGDVMLMRSSAAGLVKEKNSDYRQRFGDGLTSPANPRFTQVIANRLWKRVMRRGLVEPVDDIQDDSRNHRNCWRNPSRTTDRYDQRV